MEVEEYVWLYGLTLHYVFKSESKLFRKSNQLSCYLFEMHIISISSTNGKQFVPVVVS